MGLRLNPEVTGTEMLYKCDFTTEHILIPKMKFGNLYNQLPFG